MDKLKTSDPWAIVIIVMTCVLFILAVFVKGFSHDLLLEAGVFLVSLKLILMAKKNTETEDRLEQHLLEIKEQLRQQSSAVAK